MGEITFGNRNYDDRLCKIRATCDSTAASAAGAGGFLSFDTEASGGSLTERLRIAADGNVGIGTDSPAGQLHVYDNFAGERNHYIDNHNASGIVQLNLRAGKGNEYLSLSRSNYFSCYYGCY